VNGIISLPTANYTVVTPYLLPPGITKKVNAGDGFILDSAIKLIGAKPSFTLSSRAPIGDAEIEIINASRCLVATGANTLKDDFELTPGFDLVTLNKLKVPVVLMGVGHYGVPQVTQGLKARSIAIFKEFLDRFPIMSVRCNASYRYVTAALPEKSKQILMTSCPATHTVDGIDYGFKRKAEYNQLVVTITDRALLEQQLQLLPIAKQLFPAKKRILALHQDYENQNLWNFAKQQGFEIFREKKFESFLKLYKDTDIHFGNRVHAHLKCLSYGIVSFCTPFDLRQIYFGESLGFPIISQLPAAEIATYDFKEYLKRRDAARSEMDSFVNKLNTIISGG
jgi:hypothetical protein